MRPETGPMQFGDDWPGVFIRGDDAYYFACQLENHLNPALPTHSIDLITLRGLVDLLKSGDIRRSPECQKAKLEEN